jgi:hypothetical protein
MGNMFVKGDFTEDFNALPGSKFPDLPASFRVNVSLIDTYHRWDPKMLQGVQNTF